MNEFDSSKKQKENKAAPRLFSRLAPAYGGLDGGASKLAGSFCPVCQPRLVPPPLKKNFKAHPLMQGDVMNHAPRRNPAHRRRRIHSKGFPYVRFATVRAKSKSSPFSPSLLLRGDWLTEAGFLPDWRVRITVHRRRLVIEPLLGARMQTSYE
jgi:hypothetical protein